MNSHRYYVDMFTCATALAFYQDEWKSLKETRVSLGPRVTLSNNYHHTIMLQSCETETKLNVMCTSIGSPCAMMTKVLSLVFGPQIYFKYIVFMSAHAHKNGYPGVAEILSSLPPYICLLQRFLAVFVNIKDSQPIQCYVSTI